MKSNYYQNDEIIEHCQHCWQDVPVEQGVFINNDFVCGACLEEYYGWDKNQNWFVRRDNVDKRQTHSTHSLEETK